MKLDLKKYINPTPVVGAIEVSDLVLRFASLENGKLKQASVQLPPGIIKNGRVTDGQKLITALKGLHLQIDPLKKPVHIVLLIPTNNVYTQAFTMPLVADKNIDEAARLNLQSISPVDINTAYYGYQIIGENKQGQLEALGAFAVAQAVDEFTTALKEANFLVVAVEFPAVAVTRLVKEYGSGLKPDAPYLVIYLGSDGPDMMVIKGGNLYFSYFNSWASLQEEVGGRKLTSQDVQEFISRHVKQVINFYTSRWGQPIQDALLVESPIAKEISQIVKEGFGLGAIPFTVMKFGQLSSLWYGVLGAALRGLVPRHKDKFISLSAIGVGQEFYRELTLGFIKTWRNILIFMLTFVLLVLLVADYLLAKQAATGAADLDSRALVPLAEIQALQNEVKTFNQGVDFALKAQELTPEWSLFYEKMRLLTGDKIALQRLYVDPNLSALLIGKAVNDSAVIQFKNAMAKEPNFKDVVLPLSNIKVNEDGTVSFSLNFKISSLKF